MLYVLYIYYIYYILYIYIYIERDVLIANVDKGGTVVIMDVTDNIEKNSKSATDSKSERQFNIKEHYRQLSKDQTAANNELANNVIERFQTENLINKNVVERLRTASPPTTRFFMQPTSIAHSEVIKAVKTSLEKFL